MFAKNLILKTSRMSSQSSSMYMRSYSSIHINTMNIMLGGKTNPAFTLQEMNGPNTTVKTSSSSSSSIQSSNKKIETKPFPVVSTDNEDIETAAGHTKVWLSFF